MVGHANILGVIARYCRYHNLPQLTSLVVNEPTGLPGDKYPADYTPTESVPQSQARVFIHDWFAHGNPFGKRSDKISDNQI
jgi:hypothetical protein